MAANLIETNLPLNKLHKQRSEHEGPPPGQYVHSIPLAISKSDSRK